MITVFFSLFFTSKDRFYFFLRTAYFVIFSSRKFLFFSHSAFFSYKMKKKKSFSVALVGLIQGVVPVAILALMNQRQLTRLGGGEKILRVKIKSVLWLWE